MPDVGRAGWYAAGEHLGGGVSLGFIFKQMASLSIWVQITPVTSENQTRAFRTVKTARGCWFRSDIRGIASHPSFGAGENKTKHSS